MHSAGPVARSTAGTSPAVDHAMAYTHSWLLPPPMLRSEQRRWPSGHHHRPVGKERSAIRRDALSLGAISVVVVFGGSGSGKSTLINSARASLGDLSTAVPVVHSDRPRRSDDGDDYRIWSTRQMKAVRVFLDICWQRRLVNSLNIYGVRLSRRFLNIVNANDALLPALPALAGQYRVFPLGIHADPDVRHARIQARNPDMPPAELAQRVSEVVDYASIPGMTVINNSGALDDAVHHFGAALRRFSGYCRERQPAAHRWTVSGTPFPVAGLPA